jgi:Fic family protein
MPQKAPSFAELMREAIANPDGFRNVAAAASGHLDRYRHWDTLRHLKPPENLTHREWWLAIKMKRTSMFKPLPLQDARGRGFVYALADPIPERLHDIDSLGRGSIGFPDAITNPDTKDRYLFSSLIDEAITSSQLEGAATTRQVARDMIRAGRRPKDKSEKMILNNFATMRHIGTLRDQALSPALIRNLHRLVTEGTLADPSMAGKFRRPDQHIVVDDVYGQVLHTPPPAEQLEDRAKRLCDFANATQDVFVHPVIRSIALHFWLAYDHPFVDGNGRTARALFYWSMLHRGYWLCEFISISEIILKGPSKYGLAFLHTETDENDLTYFLIYHLGVLKRAFDQLDEYVRRRTDELRRLESELKGMLSLNHRQQALISHALRHPLGDYTFTSHRTSHGVVYQTARTDLLNLAARGLLESRKVGREWHFKPAANLEQRLRVSPERGLDHSP